MRDFSLAAISHHPFKEDLEWRALYSSVAEANLARAYRMLVVNCFSWTAGLSVVDFAEY